LQKVATNAVNKSLTVRNWLIGYYIVEYEQNGEDRAKYGAAIVDKLAENLNVKGLSSRNLKLFRQFYLSYPQISQSLTDFLQKNAIMQTLSAQLSEYKYIEKMQTLSAQNDKNLKEVQILPQKIISNLSFSHLSELIKISDTLKRTFYELECIKGNWRNT